METKSELNEGKSILSGLEEVVDFMPPVFEKSNNFG